MFNLCKEEPMSTAFRAILEGIQEVPPNHSTAHGLGTVTFDSAAVAASYSFQIVGVDYGPATGNPSQTEETDDDVVSTHYHNAPRGVNGPVVFGQINPAQDGDDLAIEQNEDGSWSVSGRWETTDPANVSIADFADILGSASVGSEVPIYFNVHTTEFPAGEIRGQLVAIADDSNNVVDGTEENDVLPGLGGDDIISGLAGDDTIEGGAGNDILSGGDGNDDFNTGAGDDLVFGDDGDDNVGGMAGRDTVFGGDGDDSVVWNDPTGDIVYGDAGNDFLRGGDTAADTIFGGEGDDEIRAVANEDLENHAADILFGDEGNDTIVGGNADDRIQGGDDDDILTGLGGADLFVFAEHESGDDTITDFEDGTDRIVLTGTATQTIEDGDHGAVITFENGTVTLAGVNAADLNADDFLLA
ncbi:MAG TPA: CHRD domain-containing protein [Alphaproteobacteria bacterium]|nr:CHRD domain-containing protein [Alphaproteobacteria bacterium]